MRQISLLALGLLTLMAGVAGAQEQRAGGIKLDGDQPIQIESDKLEVRERDSMAIFSGNVNVVQGPTLLKAGVMTVFYAKPAEGAAQNSGSPTTGSQQIDRLELRDKVYLKSNNQVLTGDEGDFDVKTSTLVLTGKEVVLTEGGNVAKGCKLVANTSNGKHQLESCPGAGGKAGRISVILQPGSQSN
jgi:lipopolysaccharide export system protein LptA